MAVKVMTIPLALPRSWICKEMFTTSLRNKWAGGKLANQPSQVPTPEESLLIEPISLLLLVTRKDVMNIFQSHFKQASGIKILWNIIYSLPKI